jgi:hypothetical protein
MAGTQPHRTRVGRLCNVAHLALVIYLSLPCFFYPGLPLPRFPAHLLTFLSSLKGIVQRDFLPLIFCWNGLFASSLLGNWCFWNLTSIPGNIHDFYIDSPLSFVAESQYSPYCFMWRVVTPCVEYNEELHMNEICAEILGFHLIQRADTPGLFTMDSRY